MMSAATNTNTSLSTLICFNSVAEAQAATKYVKEAISGASASANEYTVTVRAKSLSVMNDIVDQLLDLGGQLGNN
jgi:hypothetical protein